MDSPQNRYLTPIQDEIGLDSEVEELSVADAKVVAAIFKNKGNKSRSVLDSGIMEVITIPCTDGTPALYAVNFENGYIIVSASKKLYPILAVVDKGSFSLEDEPFGRDVLISEMKNNVEYLKCQEIKKTVR